MEQVNSEKRRPPRIPLTQEELFYVIELKKLKRKEQLLLFKTSRYYKNMNLANIGFVLIISYIVASAFVLCSWQKTYVIDVDSRYGPIVPGEQRSFSDVYVNTTSGAYLSLKTDELYSVPKKHDEIWIGKDFLFGKVLKARLFRGGDSYFHFDIYPLLFICLFVMFIVYIIYLFNLHLTRHGLLGVTTLLSLAFVYILFI